jgi:hypothetical protein
MNTTFTRLSWGVKASFRGYVEGVGGSIKTSGGATRTEEGAFLFEAIPGGNLTISPDGSAIGAIKFKGTVVFNAHGGMLDSTLTELAIESTDEGLVVTVLEAPANDDRCAVATLGPIEVKPDGTVTMGSQITIDGMYQIADNYPPGTELDPVTLS